MPSFPPRLDGRARPGPAVPRKDRVMLNTILVPLDGSELAERAGIARFGLHRQNAALLTCITPSVHETDHVHFLDGAAGGYAMAASRLKEQAGRAFASPAIAAGEARFTG